MIQGCFIKFFASVILLHYSGITRCRGGFKAILCRKNKNGEMGIKKRVQMNSLLSGASRT